jgi:hypothetical protein
MGRAHFGDPEGSQASSISTLGLHAKYHGNGYRIPMKVVANASVMPITELPGSSGMYCESSVAVTGSDAWRNLAQGFCAISLKRKVEIHASPFRSAKFLLSTNELNFPPRQFLAGLAIAHNFWGIPKKESSVTRQPDCLVSSKPH